MTLKSASKHVQFGEMSLAVDLNHLDPMLVTTGEPAGIGMDIVLQLAMDGQFREVNRPVIVLANHQALRQRAIDIYGVVDDALWQVITTSESLLKSDNLKLSFDSVMSGYLNTSKNPNTESSKQADFLVIDVRCVDMVQAGVLNTNNAQMVMTQLQLSHALASERCVAAIVTGPLQKSILIDAGLTLDDGSMFTGHTEFYMQKCNCDKVVMMLANSAMKVALVTIHLPLKDVADAITPTNVRQTVQIVTEALQTKFGYHHPKVLVCGLNPHAGEGGHLGREEIETINPVLREFQSHGIDISLAMPADTLFTKRHLQTCDAVIAMYHDQGLPVLKSHGFGDTVNLTLGLPYIRTSVDHGTALDLAGHTKEEGQASSSSLWQAVSMAETMISSSEQ